MDGKTSGYLCNRTVSNLQCQLRLVMKKHRIDYDKDFTHQDENVKEAILNEVSAPSTPLTT